MLLFAFVGLQVFAQETTPKIAPQFEYTPNEEYLTVPIRDKEAPKAEVLKTSQLDYTPSTETEVTAADIKPKKISKIPQFEYTPPAKVEIQTEIVETPKSTIEWEKMTHDFGAIDYQKPVTSTFEFVNTSSIPVTIKEAKGSCGCTATDFPKNAILPGKTAQISATYNAEDIGPFKKTVTVYTNADKDKEGTVLHITGEVIWKL